jgi:replicative DNA helicase
LGALFQAIADLDKEGKAVDVVTLQEKLREMNVPPNVSSNEFLAEIVSAVPTSANIQYYAGIVHEKATLRRLIAVGENLVNSCYTDAENIDDVLNGIESDVLKITQNKDDGQVVPISQIVMDTLDKIEKASKTKGYVTGHATGFIDLDYKTSGFQPSDLIIIAARPAMGKTAFVLNVAEHMAFHDNKAVAIFSLEMPREQLVSRMIAMESRVNSKKIREGDLSDMEWEEIIESAGSIGGSKLIIDDTPGINIRQLSKKCRKFKHDQGLDLVIIDYLQLMSGASSKNEQSRQNEVANISRALKALARELNVPVIALSQLSRAVEQRTDQKPMLSDLRESGAIEQDADVVMFIYREDYYKKDTEKKGIATIIIAKQRNGPIGEVELRWLPEFTKFVNKEREQ